jgi:hypothetical protein
VLTPAMARLPDSDLRIATAETLVRSLHAQLRAESARLAKDESKASEYPERLLRRSSSDAWSNHPIFRVLAKYAERIELPPDAIVELREVALKHMINMATEHEKLLAYMALQFIDIVDESKDLKVLGAKDIYNAFLRANDAKAYSHILTVELMAKLDPNAQGVKLGEYDSKLGRAFFQENPEVVNQEPSVARASLWDKLKPSNIMGDIGKSLMNLSERMEKK